MTGKKGIAIATDTIIYIILGVTVLTVLLFFLTSNYAPVDDRLKLERDRALFCDEYIRSDANCDGTPDVSDADALNSVKVKLVPTCNKLNVPDRCAAPGPDAPVTGCLVRNCCAVCPKK